MSWFEGPALKPVVHRLHSPARIACTPAQPHPQVLNIGSVWINMLGGRKGETCLWIACSRGRAEVVEALLAAPGIDADLANKEGYTPLHAAALNGAPPLPPQHTRARTHITRRFCV